MGVVWRPLTEPREGKRNRKNVCGRRRYREGDGLTGRDGELYGEKEKGLMERDAE